MTPADEIRKDPYDGYLDCRLSGCFKCVLNFSPYLTCHKRPCLFVGEISNSEKEC